MSFEELRTRFPEIDDDFVSKALAFYSERRLAHVKGCVQEACSLAARWGIDEVKSFTAALLHDITKNQPIENQLKLCDKYDIFDKDLLKQAPAVLHAYTGAELAADLFNVSEDIADAIRYHTSGRAGMTAFEKLIFLADIIEPSRTFAGVDEIRKTAYEDMDKAMLFSLRATIRHVEQGGNAVFYRSLEALDYFKHLI